MGGLFPIPATNTSAPIRHRLPDFSQGLSVRPVERDPTARRFRGDCAGFLRLGNHVGDLALFVIPLVSVLVSSASVQARSPSIALGHATKATAGADVSRTPSNLLILRHAHRQQPEPGRSGYHGGTQVPCAQSPAQPAGPPPTPVTAGRPRALPGPGTPPPAAFRRSRPRLEHEVEGGLRGTAEAREAASADDVPDPRLTSLLGRAHERQEIGHALTLARSGASATLALAGEPGIGKTALLDYAAREAVGMRLLGARGIESEAQIPFGSCSSSSGLALPLLGRSRRRRRTRWRARWPCGQERDRSGSPSAPPRLVSV